MPPLLTNYLKPPLPEPLQVILGARGEIGDLPQDELRAVGDSQIVFFAGLVLRFDESAYALGAAAFGEVDAELHQPGGVIAHDEDIHFVF